MPSPIEEKREISIRGASPLRHPPERVTSKDAEIVRSVRSRMMEKESERKQGHPEERGFANEYGTERGSDRRYEQDMGRDIEMEHDGKGRSRDGDRYPGRQREYSRGSDKDIEPQPD